MPDALPLNRMETYHRGVVRPFRPSTGKQKSSSRYEFSQSKTIARIQQGAGAQACFWLLLTAFSNTMRIEKKASLSRVRSS